MKYFNYSLCICHTNYMYDVIIELLDFISNYLILYFLTNLLNLYKNHTTIRKDYPI